MSVALEFRILHFETLNPLQDLDRGMCLERFSKEVVEILGATRTGQAKFNGFQRRHCCGSVRGRRVTDGLRECRRMERRQNRQPKRIPNARQHFANTWVILRKRIVPPNPRSAQLIQRLNEARVLFYSYERNSAGARWDIRKKRDHAILLDKLSPRRSV